jgi:hypothetical protein
MGEWRVGGICTDQVVVLVHFREGAIKNFYNNLTMACLMLIVYYRFKLAASRILEL